MSILITAVYIFIGLGLFGGFKAWGEAGKSLYILFFPLHALFFGLARLLGYAAIRFWGWLAHNENYPDGRDHPIGVILFILFALLIWWASTR